MMKMQIDREKFQRRLSIVIVWIYFRISFWDISQAASRKCVGEIIFEDYFFVFCLLGKCTDFIFSLGKSNVRDAAGDLLRFLGIAN